MITPHKTLSRNNNNNSKVFISAVRNLNALTCLLITKNKHDYDNNSQLNHTTSPSCPSQKQYLSDPLHSKQVFKISMVVFFWDQPFLVGWVGFFLVCFIGKNRFCFGWSTFPNNPELGWNGWKWWVAPADLLAGIRFPWNARETNEKLKEELVNVQP